MLFFLVATLAVLVWFAGPFLKIYHYAPLISLEQRIYIILFLLLLWFLKVLLIDLDAPNPFAYRETRTQKKLQLMQKRFQGALRFLKKTSFIKNNKTFYLNQLPWYLLIGPSGAGKTALLANARVNFILQRKFTDLAGRAFTPTENCNWWVTKEATIVDVPGNYLSLLKGGRNHSIKERIQPNAWRFFLNLIKQQRGKHGLQGIILTLPFPEIMKEANPKKYYASLRHLLQRIYELKQIFPYPLTFYLLITKCDLLAGFEEFFTELGAEEAAQAWGINIEKTSNLADMFSQHFDGLIKKLNQQLLSRLHQERNPMARPFIKDFPLQVERLKEFTHDFIKKLCSAPFNLPLKGVYLTSALQEPAKESNDTIEGPLNHAHRELQIFTSPTAATRPYFIKQFIAHGLTASPQEIKTLPTASWKIKSIYALATSFVLLTLFLLGKDFRTGLNQTQQLKLKLTNYQLALNNTQTKNRLYLATDLLNALEINTQTTNDHFSLNSLLKFYSHKFEQNASVIYYQALQTILLPEIKIYFETYLKNTRHQNNDVLYSVLKAYLMLGEATHFDANYIQKIILESIPPNNPELQHLRKHLSLTLNTAWHPLILNSNIIQETRTLLWSLPNGRLSYIILKSMDNNNLIEPINLGDDHGKDAFIINQASKEIPKMFTSTYFSTLLSQEAITASEEAVFGNWILGENNPADKNEASALTLLDQLRIIYINNYIDAWENFINNIKLSPLNNLSETDSLILDLIKSNSPLTQLLQILHDNTYFEPIVSSSARLQNLGAIIEDHPANENLHNQIISGLRDLHGYLQNILTADNERKAAFEAVEKRMSNHETDALMQVRLLAEKSPEPIKTWLDKIANAAWHFLMNDAANYLDTSWQNKIIQPYQATIINRYPFIAESEGEVDLNEFIQFFGSNGTFMNFYDHYLKSFIDTSPKKWRFKIHENQSLPFTAESLHQIQLAIKIHDLFFPQSNKKPNIQFSLRRYQFSPHIKLVKLNINDNQMIDLGNGPRRAHIFSWPNLNKPRITSIQLVMNNQKVLNRDFPGDWGWFRLMNQSFESELTNKKMIINLSLNKQTVKYILASNNEIHAFLALNLKHFSLPEKLSTHNLA